MFDSVAKKNSPAICLIFNACCVVSLLQSIAMAQAQSEKSSSGNDRNVPASAAGAALRTIFSPIAAPEQKTMGLMQRSFLDLAKATRERRVELAFVVDGTDSMADEIEGVKESVLTMIADLRRHCQEIGVAVVVYRDAESPTGPTDILLPKFSSDDDEIQKAIEQIVPDSGTPYFHEKPDEGLSQAIEKLPWSVETDKSRWIFLIGDAPPYSESFSNPEVPQAKRSHTTSNLIARATVKNIQIHCLLCRSSQHLADTYDAAVGDTRLFMNTLAAETGGVMLDLSRDEIVNAVIEAGSQPTYEYIEIAAVTEEEINNARQSFLGSPADPMLKEVRIAVLPHLDLSEMTFEPTNSAVQVATALRHKFKSLPGVRVTSSKEVSSQWERARQVDYGNQQQLLRSLARRMGVDYLVWGNRDLKGKSVMYSAETGQEIATATFGNDQNGVQLASKFLDQDAFKNPNSGELKLVALQRYLPKDLAQCAQRLAKNPLVEREILVALEALQQSLAFEAGDPRAKEFLDKANRSCESALALDAKNSLVYWLSANTAFNRAQAFVAAGNNAAAEEEMNQVKRFLAQAIDKDNRKYIDSKSLAYEIAADYTLINRGDLQGAIKLYEEMSVNPQICSSVRRRAHWMLVGIYSGDWGTLGQHGGEDVESRSDAAENARSHAISILANWPESPEATLLKKWLQWNPSSGKTEHNYIPKSKKPLGDLIAAKR